MRLSRRQILPLAVGLVLQPWPARAAEAPLWFSGGRPTSAARQAGQLLKRAAEEGLDPRDYHADHLSALLDMLSNGASLAPDEETRHEGEFTLAMRRYLSDLRSGRVDPRSLNADYDRPARDAADLDALLRDAVARDRLPEAAAEVAPALPLYARLRRLLAEYRVLAAASMWQQALPALPGRRLEPGQSWAGSGLLARRLEALGDLPAGTAAPESERYEGALVDGVRAFQARHGLEPDGVIGRDTWAQLAVSPAARVRQIELSMERLRWTPLLQGPRMVVVNVPEFMLRAYEWRDGRVQLHLESKVIVGDALKTRTPVFDEDMRFIEFSPYWNVPPSIARAELVPRLRRDPGYFEREGFEFVGRAGADASLSGAHLDAVLNGQLRIRQRPGPKNALGRIKFVFPNNEAIYLHDTPSPRLFQRARRDFSHGCIRVEKPVELAAFVLQNQPEWTSERIREAMDAGRSSTLRLREPLPVVIAYGTAIVRDGRPHFFADLYGQDRRLDEALAQRSREATASRPAVQPAQ